MYGALRFSLCLLVLTSLAFSQCSDFFRAAKVTDFILSDSSYEAGSPLEGSFLLQNSLDYSLPDSKLTLQITRRSAESFGDDVVAEFIAADGFDLAPGASKRISFSWPIPDGLPAGDYSVKAYMHSAGFNTGGSSLPDGVYAGSNQFTLTDGYLDYILINRSSVLLSNTTYNSLNINSLIEQAEDKNISVDFDLVNYGDTGTVILVYRLYVWDKVKHAELERLLENGTIPHDSDLAKHILSADAVGRRMSLNIDANSSQHVVLPIGVLPSDAYMLEVRTSKKQTSTIFQMRIPVQGNKAGIRFASISPFPATANQPMTLSTCISSIARLGGPAPLGANEINAELQLSLFGNDVIIYNDSREISHTPSISLSEFDFTPQSDYTSLRLLISLSDENGTLMDTAELDYNLDNLEQPNKLAVESSERNGIIRYKITLTNSDGKFLGGSIVVFLKTSEGELIETRVFNISGQLEDSFPAPPGGYAIEVHESIYGLTALSSNSTPYSKDAPSPIEADGGEEFKEGQGLVSIEVLILALVLLLVLLVLIYKTSKGLRGKRFGGE